VLALTGVGGVLLVSFATNIKDWRERERGREEKGRK
jgi:hypothetical protein